MLSLRAENLRWHGKTDRPCVDGRDSSLKRTTALVRRLRLFSENPSPGSAEVLLEEIEHQVNLSRYVGECVTSVLEAKIKPNDMFMAVKLCSSLHRQYGDFAQELGSGFARRMAVPLETDADVLPRRALLRLWMDLYICGILSDEKPFSAMWRRELGSAPSSLSVFSAAAASTNSALVLWLERTLQVLVGVAKYLQQLLSSNGDLVGPLNRLLGHLAAVCTPHWFKDSVVSVLRQLKGQLVDFESSYQQVLLTKGEASREMSAKKDDLRKGFERLVALAGALAEVMSFDTACLDALSIPAGVPSDSALAGSSAAMLGSADGAAGESAAATSVDDDVFDGDEDGRAFYSDFLDLRTMLPGALFDGPSAAGAGSDNQTAAVGAGVGAGTGAGILVKGPAATDGSGEAGAAASPALETAEESPGAAGPSTVDSADVVGLLLSVPKKLFSRSLVDEFAQAFCFVGKNRSVRRRLVAVMLLHSRQNSSTKLPSLPVPYFVGGAGSVVAFAYSGESTPYYSRLVATLTRGYPDVGPLLVGVLLEEFEYLFKNYRTSPAQKDVDARNKNIKFLAELTKAGVCPAKDILLCFAKLVDDFSLPSIEVMCTLLETAGKFLYRHADSKTRFQNLVEMMQRKRVAKLLPQDILLSLENAYYATVPPASHPSFPTGAGRNLSAEEELTNALIQWFESSLQYVSHGAHFWSGPTGLPDSEPSNLFHQTYADAKDLDSLQERSVFVAFKWLLCDFEDTATRTCLLQAIWRSGYSASLMGSAAVLGAMARILIRPAASRSSSLCKLRRQGPRSAPGSRSGAGRLSECVANLAAQLSSKIVLLDTLPFDDLLLTHLPWALLLPPEDGIDSLVPTLPDMFGDAAFVRSRSRGLLLVVSDVTNRLLVNILECFDDVDQHLPQQRIRDCRLLAEWVKAGFIPPSVALGMCFAKLRSPAAAEDAIFRLREVLNVAEIIIPHLARRWCRCLDTFIASAWVEHSRLLSLKGVSKDPANKKAKARSRLQKLFQRRFGIDVGHLASQQAVLLSDQQASVCIEDGEVLVLALLWAMVQLHCAQHAPLPMDLSIVLENTTVDHVVHDLARVLRAKGFDNMSFTVGWTVEESANMVIRSLDRLKACGVEIGSLLPFPAFDRSSVWPVLARWVPQGADLSASGVPSEASSQRHGPASRGERAGKDEDSGASSSEDSDVPDADEDALEDGYDDTVDEEGDHDGSARGEIAATADGVAANDEDEEELSSSGSDGDGEDEDEDLDDDGEDDDEDDDAEDDDVSNDDDHEPMDDEARQWFAEEAEEMERSIREIELEAIRGRKEDFGLAAKLSARGKSLDSRLLQAIGPQDSTSAAPGPGPSSGFALKVAIKNKGVRVVPLAADSDFALRQKAREEERRKETEAIKSYILQHHHQQQQQESHLAHSPAGSSATAPSTSSGPGGFHGGKSRRSGDAGGARFHWHHQLRN